jgi:hypothetical protein
VDLIRGREVDDAKTQLEFSLKRAATNVLKALEAAVADAEEAGADMTRLIVAEARIDERPAHQAVPSEGPRAGAPDSEADEPHHGGDSTSRNGR